MKLLKITARPLNKIDIQKRKLPNQITGIVITDIKTGSPFKSLEVNDIIVEAQKKKIKSIKDLDAIVQDALKSNQKTILIAFYNNLNQKRYIGIKLD